MKVLVATEKPFAAAAVEGIKKEIEGAGNELVLLEKYTEKAQLLDAVKDVDAMITGFTGNIWWLAGGMILIAVLANITAFWRIWHCYVVMNAHK